MRFKRLGLVDQTQGARHLHPRLPLGRVTAAHGLLPLPLCGSFDSEEKSLRLRPSSASKYFAGTQPEAHTGLPRLFAVGRGPGNSIPETTDNSGERKGTAHPISRSLPSATLAN